MDTHLPSFKSPPLDEVSIGIQFKRLDRLRIPHVGSFWERIRQDFPNVEHAPPILGADQNLNIDPGSGLPLPRVWLIHQTDTRLIQLQADRYNFNWRFRDGGEAYPRYPEVAVNFFKYLDSLEKFVSEEGIGFIQPTIAELTYINILPQGREWNSEEDMERVFRDFVWASHGGRFLPQPSSLNWGVSFTMPNDSGTLTARLNPAKRTRDGLAVLQFEIAATLQIRGQPQDFVRAWYPQAHEWIVKAFADMTTVEAQEQYWGVER